MITKDAGGDENGDLRRKDGSIPARERPDVEEVSLETKEHRRINGFPEKRSVNGVEMTHETEHRPGTETTHREW